MENQEHTLFIVDEDGNEIEMQGLLTFYDETFQKDYVLYVNPNDESGEVYASSYDDEGHLYPIETEDEWAVVEAEFARYLDEETEDEVEFQA